MAANAELFFEVALSEPNIFHVVGALDETIPHSDRSDRDELNRRNRMKTARGFTQQSSLMCVSRRTQGVSGAYARVGTQVPAWLLFFPTSFVPAAFSTLTTRFVLSHAQAGGVERHGADVCDERDGQNEAASGCMQRHWRRRGRRLSSLVLRRLCACENQ